MIKKTFTLIVCMLVLTLVMYRCKNKNADPLSPDQGLIDEMSKIDVGTVTLKEPDPVVSTESAIEISPLIVTLGTDLAGMASTGVEPASAKASAAQVSSFFTKAEIATLAGVTDKTITDASTTGLLPADLTAIMARADASPAMSMYLPKVTLPTVAGKEITGARIGAGDGGLDGAYEGTLDSDACLNIAQAEFDKAKARLDASRTKLLADAETKYNDQIKQLNAAEVTCKAAVPAKYAALATSGIDLAAKLHALLDANAAALGPDYLPLKAVVTLELIAYLVRLNRLAKADVQACTAKNTAGAEKAKTAADNNKAEIEAAYAAALDKAEKAKAKLVESCHNQGGGN